MSGLIRKMEAGRNLGHLLMIAFFSSSIVVLLVSSSLQLTAYFRSEKRVLYNNQQVIAEGASSAVVGFIQEKCQELATAAWLTDPETTSREEWLLVLQSLLGLQPSFRRLAVRDERFQIVAAASRYAPPGLGHPEDLQEAARFSKPHDAVSCPEISDVYMDPVTSEPLVSIRVPVVNALREFKNTLTAELNLKFMWDLVDQLKVGKTGYAYVVDHQGQVIAFGDTARVLKGENVAHLPPVREFLQDPNAQRSQRAQLYRGITGGLVVGTYVPLRTPNWAIVTELPWMEAFREVIEATGISLAIIVLMAFLAALLGLGISRRLTVPLVTLKETAMRIAGGERELQMEVDGPEEVVQLAAAFNSMSSQLQRSLKALEAQFEEIKSARDALRASEERLRLAQEGSRDAIWDWNVLEQKAYFSHAWHKMLGYEPDAFPPSYEAWVSLIHPDDRRAAEEEVNRAVRSHEAIHIEYRMKAMDGSWRWILSRGKAVAWDNDGNAVRLAGSHADITERKKAEEEKAVLEAKLFQAQKLEAVALLAGGIAHDFNNVLSVMLGRAELALMRLNPRDPHYDEFNEILTVGRRCADLTRQLLMFARQQTIAPKVLDLNSTISSILKLLARITGENIDLSWKPSGNLWAVKMDPAQIDQLLANLLVNARDAISDVGRVIIETHNVTFDAGYCETHPGFTPGDYVMLAVSDDGCGMEKETLAKIFDPFYTTKALGRGTGLGLATVYGIVKQNNGFINVYSEPGKGTTFRIYLPRDPATAAETEPGRKRTLPRGNETVLLVEDDISLLGIGTAMLRELGYTVLAAGSPVAAIQKAEMQDGPIHLMISDVIMPEMNGRELERRLETVCPSLKCLFVSGYTANVIAHQGVLDEGIHFLQKPFSIQELAVKVREVLDEA